MHGRAISIVIVDEQFVVRRGLHEVIAGLADCRIVGEAGNGHDALHLVNATHPDIIVMGLILPGLSGLTLLPKIRSASPGTRPIIFSIHAEKHYVVEAFAKGAFAYVLKNSNESSLRDAIGLVSRGRMFVCPTLTFDSADVAFERGGPLDHDPFLTLTDREREVLVLGAEGLTHQAVAQRLRISIRTAEKHRANLMRKLRLRSQADLILFAIHRQLIVPIPKG